MTVCVGLKLPWPEGVNKFGTGRHGPEMVALATDSRLTDTNNGQSSDNGEKLFKLCGNAVCAYSGSTWVGELLVRAAMQQRIPGVGRLAPEVCLTDFAALDFIRVGLVFAHRKAMDEDGFTFEQARVKVLVATADRKRVRWVRFDTGNKEAPYKPIELPGGVYAIGEIEALTEARKACARFIINDTRYSENPMFWAAQAIMAVDEVAKSHKHETVGGMVQAAILTPSHGVQLVAHADLPWNGLTWGEGTLTQPEGKGWVTRFRDQETGRTRGHLPFDANERPSTADPGDESEDRNAH